MGKVGEHGVNLRRSEAIRDTLRRVASGDLECAAAQTELDANFAFSITALAVAGVAACEMGLMHTDSIERFGALMR